MRDPVTDDFRQMLLQRFTAGDVDHLRAAADREDRQLTSVRGPAKLQFEDIELALRRASQRVPSLAVAPCVCWRCMGIASKF